MIQTVSTQGSDLGNIADVTRPAISRQFDFPRPHAVSTHQHSRGQFILCNKGSLTVQAGQILFEIASDSACWIPPGHRHKVFARDAARYSSVYLTANEANGLPRQATTTRCSRLLTALIETASVFGPDYTSDSPETRLVLVMLDQLRTIVPDALALVLPFDRRLQSWLTGFLAQPNSNCQLADLTRVTGLSRSTLERIFKQQTGMCFSQWRKRVLFHAALSALKSDASITRVAYDLGYSHPAAFSAMFRSLTGRSPRHYLMNTG